MCEKQEHNKASGEEKRVQKFYGKVVAVQTYQTLAVMKVRHVQGAIFEVPDE